jgi:hypothetical protein
MTVLPAIYCIVLAIQMTLPSMVVDSYASYKENFAATGTAMPAARRTLPLRGQLYQLQGELCRYGDSCASYKENSAATGTAVPATRRTLPATWIRPTTETAMVNFKLFVYV